MIARLLTPLLLFLPSILFGQAEQKNNTIGHWSYCDGYTFKYLALNSNNTFVWHYNSCTGDNDLTGSYTLSGDTIILTGKERQLKMLKRSDKIFSYAGLKGEYPEFQPLRGTTKKTLKGARSECIKKRKQRWKKYKSEDHAQALNDSALRNDTAWVRLHSAKMVLNGTYQGKNFYVQNPFAGSGAGFCTLKVLVNGKTTTDELNSSAFEINLDTFNFKLGDPIEIVIVHLNDCKPKMLNPFFDQRRSTFVLVSMEASPDGTLKWVSKNETNKLPFIVEQYRWNKWVKVGEVEGKGGMQENSYEFKVTPHSGKNQLRIKQVDYITPVDISRPVSFISTVAEVTLLDRDKTKKEIIFSAETQYEIYDASGNVLKKGFGKTIDCSDFKYGVYYVNYDNKTEDVVFKKPK